MNEVQWCDVVGYEDFYKVSTEGVIVRKAGYWAKVPRTLTPFLIHGYPTVSLSLYHKVTKFAVHRLVAQAFLENWEEKACVNHKNGDRADNRVENLEWVTYSENNAHSYRILKNPHPCGKLTLGDVTRIKQLVADGIPKKQIWEEYGISKRYLNRILAGVQRQWPEQLKTTMRDRLSQELMSL